MIRLLLIVKGMEALQLRRLLTAMEALPLLRNRAPIPPHMINHSHNVRSLTINKRRAVIDAYQSRLIRYAEIRHPRGLPDSGGILRM